MYTKPIETWLKRGILPLGPEWLDFMLKGLQSGPILGPIPPELSFIGDKDIVDLGFDRLFEGVRLVAILRAYADTGLIVPGTHWRLRFVYPYAVVEIIDGSEAETLPMGWEKEFKTVKRFSPS